MSKWPLLPDSALDLTRDTFDYTQSLSDTLGDLGTDKDGFDSFIGDTILVIQNVGDPGASLVDDLNLAASIAGSIDPNSLLPDATSLPHTLAEGDGVLSDVTALNSAAGTPAPPTGGGGTSGGGGTRGGGGRSPVRVPIARRRHTFGNSVAPAGADYVESEDIWTH